MACPDPIDAVAVTAPKTFANWARALSFTASKAFSPTTRGEIVAIIQQAEAAGQRVKWAGSRWSFTENFFCNDLEIESDGIMGAIDPGLILDLLPLSDSAMALRTSGNLAHIKGGTKVFNVNRILHGLMPALNGGGGDEASLTCDPVVAMGAPPKALPTLGGSGGQSIAGLLATGSHGGDVFLPPIADAVMAIHLIGPGGQEWWIERSSGFTAENEADVQSRLRAIAADVPVEMCSDIIVRKDDAFFNSVLVSVGRMGFVYSLVLASVPAFKLHEVRSNEMWETFRGNLSAANFATFMGSTTPHYFQVLINPFGSDGMHQCKVARRDVVECATPNAGLGGGGVDPLAMICGRQDIRILLAILVPALAVLLVTEGGLVALSAFEAATAGALAAIPFIGWILATAMFAALAVTVAAITAIAATIAALTLLIGYLTVSGPLTSGELVAAIVNFFYATGLKSLMTRLLTALFDMSYPILPEKIGISWKIMDTYGYQTEDFCQKVDSMEFAFDVTDTTGGGYQAFIDEVLGIFDDLFNRSISVAGLMALRFTTKTGALLGMSKFPMSCHIEIPILRNFGGNAEFLSRVQTAAIAHGGVAHWGQLMSTYTARDVAILHGADLTTWRRTLTELIRRGAGQDFTFSNDFTATYNLEPLDDTVITAVIFEVTVGDDSLGDTDWLRHNVSDDRARVILSDGTVIDASMNEGAEWPRFTTHTRSVTVPAGTMWGQVSSVQIEHHAAGDDINADNWTMTQIVISSVSDLGVTQERFRLPFDPPRQFRKNDHQLWQHDFI